MITVHIILGIWINVINGILLLMLGVYVILMSLTGKIELHVKLMNPDIRIKIIGR